MLRFFRTKIKVIIYIVAIGFILGLLVERLWQGTTEDRQKIATIKNEKISYREFHIVYNNLLKRYQQQDQEIDEKKSKEIAQEALDSIIEERIAFILADELNIQVSDNEVFESIRYFFASQRVEFNEQIYARFLQDIGQSHLAFEEGIRRDLLVNKVKSVFSEGIKFSEDEGYYNFKLLNNYVKAEYIEFPFEKYYDKVNYTEEQLKEFYEKNKNSFFVNKKAKVKYIFLEITPSNDDLKKAEERIYEIHKKLIEGTTFEALAGEYSEDESNASRGGDLGFFKKGVMVKEFDDVVFKLKNGEISKPFKTKFGWHIAKKIAERQTEPEDKKSKKEKEVHVKHILIKIEPSDETLDKLENISREFFYKLYKDKILFEEIAKQYNLKIFQTDYFEEGKAEIDKFNEVFEFGKDEKIGYPFKEETGDKKGYYVFVLEDLKDAYFKSYEEIKDTVKADFLKEKSQPYALESAESFLKEIENKKDISKLLKEKKLNITTTDTFTYGAKIKNLEDSEEISKEIFFTKLDTYSKPLKLKNAYLIFKIIERIDAKEEDYAMTKSFYQELFARTKKIGFSKDYLEKLKKKYDVKTYLDKFFTNL